MDDKKKLLVVIAVAALAIGAAILVITKTTAGSGTPEPQGYVVQPPSDKQSGEMNKAGAGAAPAPGAKTSEGQQ